MGLVLVFLMFFGIFSVSFNNYDNTNNSNLETSFVDETLDYLGNYDLTLGNNIDNTLSIYYYMEYWYVIQDDEIYKYNLGWDYISNWLILEGQNDFPESICFSYGRNSSYVLGMETDIVYEYNDVFDNIINSTYIGNKVIDPIEIYYYSGDWFILDSNGTISRYDYYWNYINSFSIVDDNDINIIDVYYDGNYLWVLGDDNKIYKYYNWNYMGYFYDLSEQSLSVTSIGGLVDTKLIFISGIDEKKVFSYIYDEYYYDFYPVDFSLFAQDYSPLDESKFSLYIDGVLENFGIIDIYTESVEIIVYENDFNIEVFNSVENLLHQTNFDILCNARKLTINLNTRKIGEFILTEQSTFNSINFIMDPYTTKEIIVGQGLYEATWLNTENNLITIYNFDMSSNREITLNTVFYNVSFTLTDQFLKPLDISIYTLYINQTKEDFGVIELDREDVLITVYDRFGIAGFSQIIDLSGLLEYNIIVPIYELKVKNLANEMGNFTLKEKITQKTYDFNLDPDSDRIFKLRSANYTIIWLNGENGQIYEYDIDLISDFELTLESIYYIVFFRIFNFDGLGLEPNLIRFYINGVSSDLGNIELNSKENELLILDFFDNIIYNETIDLSDKTEWNIYVELYKIELRNKYDFAIDLIFERNGITVNITIPALMVIEYRFILNIDYSISWYRSSNNTYIDGTDIVFTKENLIMSFGVNIGSNINNEQELNNIILIILVSVVSIISVVGVIIIIKYIKKNKMVDNDK